MVDTRAGNPGCCLELDFGFPQASMREENSSWNHTELASPVGKGFVGSSFALVKVGHFRCPEGMGLVDQGPFSFRIGLAIDPHPCALFYALG